MILSEVAGIPWVAPPSPRLPEAERLVKAVCQSMIQKRPLFKDGLQEVENYRRSSDISAFRVACFCQHAGAGVAQGGEAGRMEGV